MGRRTVGWAFGSAHSWARRLGRPVLLLWAVAWVSSSATHGCAEPEGRTREHHPTRGDDTTAYALFDDLELLYHDYDAPCHPVPSNLGIGNE